MVNQRMLVLRPTRAAYTVNLRKRRCWYDDAPPAPTPPSDKPTEPAPDKSGDKPAEGQAATFTQADVDRIVGERAKRAKDAAVSDLLKELGLENVDGLKTLVTDAQKRAADELTEAQRLQGELDKANAKFDAERTRADSAEAARIADKVDARLEALATRARAEFPEDVVKYAREHHAEAVTALVAEDGRVDEKAVEKLLGEVRKARPNWFAVSGPGSPSNAGGKPPQPSGKVELNVKPRL